MPNATVIYVSSAPDDSWAAWLRAAGYEVLHAHSESHAVALAFVTRGVSAALLDSGTVDPPRLVHALKLLRPGIRILLLVTSDQRVPEGVDAWLPRGQYPAVLPTIDVLVASQHRSA